MTEVQIDPAEEQRQKLAEIEARVNAATEGPWEIIGGNEYLTGVDIHIGPSDEGGVRLRDAEFIAHTRADVPELLAIIREQAAQIAAVREVTDEIAAGRDLINLAISRNLRRALGDLPPIKWDDEDDEDTED
jgi:hypothetical protein